jgi:hypothetical protein
MTVNPHDAHGPSNQSPLSLPGFTLLSGYVLLVCFDIVFGGRESLSYRCPLSSVAVIFLLRSFSGPVWDTTPAQSVVCLKWWKLVGSLLKAAFSIVNGVAIREHVGRGDTMVFLAFLVLIPKANHVGSAIATGCR